MQSAMLMFVVRFASEGPQMQSAMLLFVARFASEGPRRTLSRRCSWNLFQHENPGSNL